MGRISPERKLLAGLLLADASRVRNFASPLKQLWPLPPSTAPRPLLSPEQCQQHHGLGAAAIAIACCAAAPGERIIPVARDAACAPRACRARVRTA